MSLIKKIKRFNGTAWEEFNIAEAGSNLQNGEGLDSIIQTYSGEVDDTHFSNTAPGESAVAFGEANTVGANRALSAGKLNIIQVIAANSITAGLQNNVIGAHGLTVGTYNDNRGIEAIMAGAHNYSISVAGITAGHNNGNYSAYSLVVGTNNLTQNNDGIIVGGYWSKDNQRLLMALGNGTSEDNRSNAFEVYQDGRAKVYGVPTEDNDVVRLKDLSNYFPVIKPIEKNVYYFPALSVNNDNSISYWSIKGTPEPSGEKVVIRSKQGRAQIQDPVEDMDIANKRYVDDKIGNLNIENGEANGSIKTKNYIDPTDGSTQSGGTVNALGAIAFGKNNIITDTAKRAAAIGNGNYVAGNSGFAQGQENKVYESCGIAMGRKNENNAPFGFIAGFNNIIQASDTNPPNSNIVLGNDNIVYYGNSSILIGSGLRAENSYYVALGKFNDWNTKPNVLLAVGNGDDDNSRSNAFEVLKDGRAKVKTTPIDENDVVRLGDLNGINNLNLENGEGHRSIIQLAPTLENIYIDFRHYSAAYGVASAQGDDSPDAVEVLMNTYTYEQLLSMIAQANFGGDTNMAQSYLDNMINTTLSDMEFSAEAENINHGTSSSAFGVENTVWSPAAFVTGYKNTIGHKGYPLQAIGSVAMGIGLNVHGSGSVAMGRKSGISPSDYSDDANKTNVTQFLSNLKDIGIITTYDENTRFEFDGIHSGSNFSYNGYVGENAGWGNAVFGLSAIDGGSNNLTAGNQSVTYGHSNATFGFLNKVKASHSIVAGAANDVTNNRQDTTTATFNSNNHVTNCANSFTAGHGNYVTGRETPITLGYRLRNEVTDMKTVIGKFNEDKVGNLFEVGNGTSDTYRSNAFEILRDGTVKAKKYTTLEENGVLGSQVIGIQSAAFGGLRYDYAKYKIYQTIEAELDTTFTGEYYIDENTNTKYCTLKGVNSVGSEISINLIDEALNEFVSSFEYSGIRFSVHTEYKDDGSLYVLTLTAEGAETSIICTIVDMPYKGRTASSAEGNQAFAGGGSSHTYGDWGFAFGKDANSYGKASVAFGGGTQAGDLNNPSGYSFAFAANELTTALGRGSTAFGLSTKANGEYSLATGSNTTAEGIGSFAQGYKTNASGMFAMAAGDQTWAFYYGSAAFGQYTKTGRKYQFVTGICNVGKDDTLFEIGNGLSDLNRSNAFEVLKDGRVKVYGAPVEENEVVRLQELNTKFDKNGGTISGDVTIGGNLTVEGTTSAVDIQNLRVEDNVIVANTTGMSFNNAGFAIMTGMDTTYGIMYNPADDGVMIGSGTIGIDGEFTYNEGQAQYLATIDWNMGNGNIPVFNSVSRTLESSGLSAADLATKEELETKVTELEATIAELEAKLIELLPRTVRL